MHIDNNTERVAEKLLMLCGPLVFFHKCFPKVPKIAKVYRNFVATKKFVQILQKITGEVFPDDYWGSGLPQVVASCVSGHLEIPAGSQSNPS